jgi:pseudouridine synthase
LLTNDGLWAQRLQHPQYQVQKVYHVTVDRPITRAHIQQIRRGTQIDDTLVIPDSLAYDPIHPATLTITLHSGKKRVIRRILKTYGYTVTILHRTQYGPLGLQALAPGQYRPLTDQELARISELHAQKNVS